MVTQKFEEEKIVHSIKLIQFHWQPIETCQCGSDNLKYMIAKLKALFFYG